MIIMMRDMIAYSCIKMEVYLHANGGIYEYFSVLTSMNLLQCDIIISNFSHSLPRVITVQKLSIHSVHMVLCPSCLQGCSWRSILAYPWCAKRFNDWTVKFTSLRALDWYGELRIIWSDQNSYCDVKARHEPVTGFLPLQIRYGRQTDGPRDRQTLLQKFKDFFFQQTS